MTALRAKGYALNRANSPVLMALSAEPAFSADGRFLATGAQGGSARLLDLTTGSYQQVGNVPESGSRVIPRP